MKAKKIKSSWPNIEIYWLDAGSMGVRTNADQSISVLFPRKTAPQEHLEFENRAEFMDFLKSKDIELVSDIGNN